MRSLAFSALAGSLLATAVLAGGCADNQEFVTEDRLENGLVIVLPGIEGVSEYNRNIRRGIEAAGIYRALPIVSWGRPIPLIGVLANQIDFIGNRLAGINVARMVKQYQDNHPGKPVYIVGHSGGGGVAVFAAQALPEGRKLQGLVLLSASISSAYDLTKALNRCENGIVCFYNKGDGALLGVGTIVLGNVDGTHGPAAGLIGFDWPSDRARDEKKRAYRKLYQVHLGPEMLYGDEGAHSAATNPHFVSLYVAPWLMAQTWPPMDAQTYVGAEGE